MVGMATALAEQAKLAGVTIRLRMVDIGTVPPRRADGN
jgi:hypothetical protein